MPVPGRVYAGGTPFFDESTGRRTGGIQSPPIMPIPGLPSGPFTPGEGGMSPGQLPTGGMMRTMEFIDNNNNGIDDRDEKPPRGDPKLQPIKQAPIRTDVMPPPSDYNNEDLFGAPGAGSYDNLMSRAFQEYSSGESPYAGAADFLMNRSVFDRGVRPESSMPSTDMSPSYGYSDPGGMSGMAQLQAQQPALQAQYDQFAQQIQSAQEAAQQAAQEAAARQQEQTDLASSERQALMDRIAALEGREEPDLDAFGQQLRQDILGEVDLDALRREITGEVLQIAQADFPDVMQIRDEVMSFLPEQEQIDVENLRRQIQEAIDTGAPEEEIVALRTELQNRIRPVEEQLAGLQDERGDIAQQIGELQGQFGSLPDIDVDAIREQIMRNLPEQERVDIEALQRRIQESIDAGAPDEEIAGLRLELEQRLAPVEERVGSIRDQVAQFRENFDPAALREQIGNLRGRLEGINPQTMQDLDFGEIARRVQEQLPQDRGVVPPDVLERIRAVEQREGPDLGSIREQIGELRGQLSQRPEDRGVVPPDVLERLRAVEQREGPDLSGIAGQIAALENRGLPPEVLERLRAVEQRKGPDEAAIAERVRSGLDPRIADLQQRFSEVDTSAQAMADRIAALREQQGQATEGRRGLSERLAALREQQGRAAQGRRELEDRLSGRLEEIRGGFNPLSERIAQLQGQFAERPNLTSDAVQEMIKASLANRTSAGIKAGRGGRG
jgi:ABC-type phosphate transport system auxiliary subunit